MGNIFTTARKCVAIVRSSLSYNQFGYGRQQKKDGHRSGCGKAPFLASVMAANHSQNLGGAWRVSIADNHDLKIWLARCRRDTCEAASNLVTLKTMKLSDWLELKNKSPYWLAPQLGVEPATVYRWMDGTRMPRREAMAKIAEVTAGAVTANDFFSPKKSSVEVARVA